MTNLSPKLAILIAGPTASGKSEAAVRLAERLNGIIINADAMQVYEDLKIISARPDAQEIARAPHHLFGHVDAHERYSVGKWLDDVKPLLHTASKRDQPVILVGGTGLYFKALLEGLSEVPDIPAQITSHWNHQLTQQGSLALHAELMAQDAQYAGELEPNDGQRIVRALAVKQATGKSIRLFQNSEPLLERTANVIARVLLPDRQQLYDRIDARFDTMIEQGALDEAKALLARGLPADLPALRAIGIPELAAFLSGEHSLQDAAQKAKTNSRRYAKRQMTWIRGQMGDWMSFTDPDELVRQCLDLCNHRA